MSRRAFVIGVLAVVFLIVSLYRAKYGAQDSAEDIARLKVEIAEALRERDLLEAEFAHMSRREWIEEYARTRLGMGPAQAHQFAREAELDALLAGADPETAR